MTDQTGAVRWSTAELNWSGQGYRFTVEVDLGYPVDQHVVYEARECLAYDLEGLLGTKIRDLELTQDHPAMGPGRLAFVAPSQVLRTDPAQVRRVVEEAIARGAESVKEQREELDTLGARWLGRLRKPD